MWFGGGLGCFGGGLGCFHGPVGSANFQIFGKY